MDSCFRLSRFRTTSYPFAVVHDLLDDDIGRPRRLSLLGLLQLSFPSPVVLPSGPSARYPSSRSASRRRRLGSRRLPADIRPGMEARPVCALPARSCPLTGKFVDLFPSSPLHTNPSLLVIEIAEISEPLLRCWQTGVPEALYPSSDLSILASGSREFWKVLGLCSEGLEMAHPDSARN